MSTLLNMFESFLADEHASEMYIQGIAGTGKTTSLGDLIKYCQANEISTVTCAYTHKAVSVLASKLPLITTTHSIKTLHSFLKKKPTINSAAKLLHEVDGNSKASTSPEDLVYVLFIDEFSMIGEKDYEDIKALQYNAEGKLVMKALYIGDPNQLPPVKDKQIIKPNGQYVYLLTKVHRQKNNNQLVDTLMTINDYINDKEAEPLKEHDTFKRNIDIIGKYKQDTQDKIILAYTNEQVERINAEIQGRKVPIVGDTIYSPTLRKHYTLHSIKNNADTIVTISHSLLTLNSSYKELETLHNIAGVKFYDLINEDGEEYCYAAVFGHAAYLEISKDLASDAVKANNAISAYAPGVNVTDWSKDNWSHPLARARAGAWRHYLAFKSNVLCLDFAHAMTVHKSQGSTYKNVYLDIQDINKCAKSNYSLYLKLLYVGISRASNIVYTN